jgi:hypothetical protein
MSIFDYLSRGGSSNNMTNTLNKALRILALELLIYMFEVLEHIGNRYAAALEVSQADFGG